MRFMIVACILSLMSLAAAEQPKPPSTILFQVGFGRIVLWPGGGPEVQFSSTSDGIVITEHKWDADAKRWTLRMECTKAVSGFLRVTKKNKDIAKAKLVPFELILPSPGGVINGETGEGGAVLTFKPNIPGIEVRFISLRDGMVWKNGKKEWSMMTDDKHQDGAYVYMMKHLDGGNETNYGFSLWQGASNIDEWTASPAGTVVAPDKAKTEF